MLSDDFKKWMERAAWNHIPATLCLDGHEPANGIAVFAKRSLVVEWKTAVPLPADIQGRSGTLKLSDTSFPSVPVYSVQQCAGHWHLNLLPPSEMPAGLSLQES